MHLIQSSHPLPLLLLILLSTRTLAFPSDILEGAALQPLPLVDNSTLEYMDPTLPPLSTVHEPECSLLVLQHDFAHTVGAPPVTAAYNAPDSCPPPWSRVILELSASASDLQKDRIAAVWLNRAEILRTTTPFSMAPGVVWHIQKEITRYTALLRSEYGSGPSGQFSMMLENSNETFPGVYSFNVSLHFYRGTAYQGTNDGRKLALGRPARLDAHPRILQGLYREPADLILPISRSGGHGAGSGFWFKVTNVSDVQVAKIAVPRNTYRAVLEVYASHHDDDECWYANPYRTASSENKSNGGFREVVASIDGKYVGSAVPFPVIYPGSINPFLWAPVSPIGAYDHPSYDLELTPFVGQLVDGKLHDFGLTVRESQPHWLVDANLHLWLDAWSDQVEGALVRYVVPPYHLSRVAVWKNVEGKSKVRGQVSIRFAGWVNSSKGNITTNIRHKMRFKSNIDVEGKGNVKNVEVLSKVRNTVRLDKDDTVIGRVSVDTINPLLMKMTTVVNSNGSRTCKTKLSHEMVEVKSMSTKKEEISSTLADRQESEGLVKVEDGVFVQGSGATKSRYKFRDNEACYLRSVRMVGCKVKDDVDSTSCSVVAAS